MIKRELEKELKDIAKGFRVIAVVGPRQSGKSTIVQSTFKKYKYVNFERKLDELDFAKNDPNGFLEAYENEYGIIIDEFQHAPDILSYIQVYVDKYKKPGYFILTSSQNFLANENISQSLAGRIAIVTLLPLSVGELKKEKLLPSSIEKMVFKGNYPELYDNPRIKIDLYYRNYITTYLERDVRALRNVANLSVFQKFMQLCAARTGQILNISSLASDCSIKRETAEAWLSVLEASYIIFLQKPYSAKFTRRLIKSPKLYFYDSGLACSLLGLNSLESVRLSSYRGNIIESFIVSEIQKMYFNQTLMPKTYFWRDQTGNEIDCLLEKPETLVPVEIKSSKTTSSELFKGLMNWKSITKNENVNTLNGYIIYAGSELQKRSYGTLLSWKDINQLKSVIKESY
jgi:uncharacterized protein